MAWLMTWLMTWLMMWQGNTIPATFWMIAYILSEPTVHARVVGEVRKEWPSQPDSEGHFDYDALVYTEACFKESMRIKALTLSP